MKTICCERKPIRLFSGPILGRHKDSLGHTACQYLTNVSFEPREMVTKLTTFLSVCNSNDQHACKGSVAVMRGCPIRWIAFVFQMLLKSTEARLKRCRRFTGHSRAAQCLQTMPQIDGRIHIVSASKGARSKLGTSEVNKHGATINS